jgi:hypothetical protein
MFRAELAIEVSGGVYKKLQDGKAEELGQSEGRIQPFVSLTLYKFPNFPESSLDI